MIHKIKKINNQLITKWKLNLIKKKENNLNMELLYNQQNQEEWKELYQQWYINQNDDVNLWGWF